MQFVDTNVLLYSVSTAADEAGKAAIARAVLDRDDLALSVQVLQEFYVQATHARRADRLTHKQASQFVESLLRFPVQETTVRLMKDAIDLGAKCEISYWDAAIIAAARILSCPTVLSEDLGDGKNYLGVKVENPFRGH